MKKILIPFISLILYNGAFGQDKIEEATSAVIKEGKNLYKSEMASWYGTDLFLQKFSHRKEKIGGYFSYTEDDISRCIFFSRSETPKVIGAISFDSTFNINTAKSDSSERDFTPYETDIYTIRKIALAEINSDTLFKRYKNTSLNLIPLVDKGAKKVYILTGPQNNKLNTKKQLHKNIIPIKYAEEKDEAVTMHTHLPASGDYITATDICTLLLYDKFAKWKQHIVVSEGYVSMWDFKTDQLVVMTKKAWDGIYKDQEKGRKN